MKVKATLTTMLALLISAFAASAAMGATQSFTQETDVAWDNDATPYPSELAVNGTIGEITKVTVGLTDLDNTDETDDLAFMLQSPVGETVRLMNGAGGEGGAFSVDITFDDDAVSTVPAPLVSATFKPTDVDEADFMDPPAPPPPYGQTLSVFDGASANGTWRLFVADYNLLGSGSVKAWTLNITTKDPDPSALALKLSAEKQKLARKLDLTVNASEAGKLVFGGRARGSADVPKGKSKTTLRINRGAFKALKRKAKKGKKVSFTAKATLLGTGDRTATDSVKVKFKKKK